MIRRYFVWGLLLIGSYLFINELSFRDSTLAFEDIISQLRESSSFTAPATHSEYSALVESVLAFVVREVHHGAATKNSRNSREVLDDGVGLCFDKARVIQSIFESLGIRSRRVYVGFTYGDVTQLLARDLTSHTLVELRTPVGDLLVEPSYGAFLITDDGMFASLDDLLSGAVVRWTNNRFDAEAKVPINFESVRARNIQILPGVIDRGGDKYFPYIPLPDVSLYDVFFW